MIWLLRWRWTGGHVIVTVFHGVEGQRAHLGVLTMRRDEWDTFPMRGRTGVEEQEDTFGGTQ